MSASADHERRRLVVRVAAACRFRARTPIGVACLAAGVDPDRDQEFVRAVREERLRMLAVRASRRRPPAGSLSAIERLRRRRGPMVQLARDWLMRLRDDRARRKLAAAVEYFCRGAIEDWQLRRAVAAAIVDVTADYLITRPRAAGRWVDCHRSDSTRYVRRGRERLRLSDHPREGFRRHGWRGQPNVVFSGLESWRDALRLIARNRKRAAGRWTAPR